MTYPILIHKDPDTDYGVTVPGLPGCFSAGTTFDEALSMTREAIQLHLQGLHEESLPIPPIRSIKHHQNSNQFAPGIWRTISI